MDSDLNLEWDGREKRLYPGLQEHMAGLRHDAGELKLAMRDVAEALRRFAVLEESHKDTRAAAISHKERFEEHIKEFNELERKVATFKGALWLVGFVLTLGAAGITTAMLRGFDAMSAANTHLQTDNIKSPQDVLDALKYYRELPKGMS